MEAKAAARERFDSARDGLIALSHRIHANPELGFEEEKASTWLCESGSAGFTVEKGICDCPQPFAPAPDRVRCTLRFAQNMIACPHRPRLRSQHHCGFRSRCGGCCRKGGG